MEEYIVIWKGNSRLIQNRIEELIVEITEGNQGYFWPKSSFPEEHDFFLYFPKDITMDDLRKELQEYKLLEEII